MDLVLSFAATVLFLSAGFGASALLLRRRAAASWAELGALTLLLGALATTLMWWVVAMFLLGAQARVVVALMAALLGGVGVAVWRRERPRLDGGAAFVLLTIPLCAAVAWVASEAPFDWDGLFIWELKAEAISVEDGIPWRYLGDDSRAWSHPVYPLLVPLLRAWLLGWHGIPHEGLAKASGVLFLVAAAGLLLATARRLGRGTSAFALVLLTTTPLAILGGGSVTSGYADFPLAVYYLGAVLYLLPAAAGSTSSDWRLAGWLAAALPWTKQEGKILWACWVCLALVALGPRRWRDIGRAALPGAIVWIAWDAFTRFAQVEPTKVFYHPSLMLLRDRLHLADDIGRALAKLALAPAHWGLLWVLFAAAALLRPSWPNQPSTRQSLVLVGAVIVPLPLYCLPYFFSRWEPVTLHVEHSFARLLLHLSLPAMLLVAARTAGALAALRGAGPGGGARDVEEPSTASSPDALGPILERLALRRGVVVFLPSIGWDVHLVQRPHHLARAFAAKGFVVVFDCTGRPTPSTSSARSSPTSSSSRETRAFCTGSTVRCSGPSPTTSTSPAVSGPSVSPSTTGSTSSRSSRTTASCWRPIWRRPSPRPRW